jgi:toxin ParE1/3/4
MAHRISSVAEADLDDIWLYVARASSSLEVANHLIDSITNRFPLLAKYPYLGRSRDQDFGFEARTLVVGEYVIVYYLEGKDVLILRVVHGKRDLEALFGH